jgi:uncharacterized repeat protein (TIGR03899 family)
MDAKDLMGLGEIFTKFFDTVSKGVGTFYRPYAIRKEAKAHADALETILQAAKKTGLGLESGEYKSENFTLKLISSDVEQVQLLLPERAASRENYQQQIEQLNIEAITGAAADELVHEESVSSAPVDETWIKRFFDMAKDISTDEMQLLWGKILAGEVKQPNSFSLRTLESIRTLSKLEAEVFQKLANFAITNGNSTFIIYESSGQDLTDKFSITYGHILLMQEAGLISVSTTAVLAFKPDIVQNFLYGDKFITIERTESTSNATLPVLLFSRTGTELISILTPETNSDYIKEFAYALKRRNIASKVFVADIIEIKGGVVKHTDGQEIIIEEQ